MAEGMIGWKEAEERGLKPLRTVDARITPHRDGTVFFAEELVEYDSGDRGWRRRQGTSPAGRPYTEIYRTRDEAEKAVERIARRVMIRAAADMLTDEGHEYSETGLDRMCASGAFGNARDLADAFQSRLAVIDEAIAEIARRGLGQVSNASLLMPYFFGGDFTVEALVGKWSAQRAAWDEAVRSRELEARKEKERAERLDREYEFIVRKAQEKASADGLAVPSRETMVMEDMEGDEAARLLDLIAASLATHPYLRHVVTEPTTNARLWVSPDGLAWKEWGDRYEKWERKRQIAKRAMATDAFGEDPADHWGVVKSRLLRRLKPEMLGILHRRDVQERLDRARAEGISFVVFGDWGFLWNSERDRWEQREFERPETDGGKGLGSRLWREGRIVSNNHGRIIVLPFTKADGINVDGYTRNGPHQGRAEPRAEPLEIPFAVYDDLGRDDTWDHEGNALVG